MTGRYPTFVDHINGNRSDNRWSNLREVTKSENSKNMALLNTNKSGVAGVFWNKGKKKWTARIESEGVTTHLGHFESLDRAAEVRKQAESIFGFHKNHGRKNG